MRKDCFLSAIDSSCLIRFLSAAFAGLSFLACGVEGQTSETSQGAPPAVPDFPEQDFYEELRADAESFGFSSGDWTEDLGDAAFYGLAVYSQVASPSQEEQARRIEAKARTLTLLESADFLAGDVNEYVMSALGLIDAMSVERDEQALEILDGFVYRLNNLASLFDWYIEDLGQDNWALTTYGPTSTSALLGLVNAQYALLLGDASGDKVKFAMESEEKISEKAWSGQHYEFSPNRTDVDLYPNVAMLLLNTRLYQLTRDDKYKARALSVYQAIQPLRQSSDPVYYYSAYSAGAMGAMTKDYFTLSSHNYLTFALLTLFEITRDDAYISEADSVIRAIRTRLSGQWCLSDVHRESCECQHDDVCVAEMCTEDRCQHGVLHHWIDGRIANTTDAEFFCSGCNLQLLYSMWYRQNLRISE